MLLKSTADFPDLYTMIKSNITAGKNTLNHVKYSQLFNIYLYSYGSNPVLCKFKQSVTFGSPAPMAQGELFKLLDVCLDHCYIWLHPTVLS